MAKLQNLKLELKPVVILSEREQSDLAIKLLGCVLSNKKVNREHNRYWYFSVFSPRVPKTLDLNSFLKLVFPSPLPVTTMQVRTPPFPSPAQQAWAASFTTAIFSWEMFAYNLSYAVLYMDKPHGLILKKMNTCKHSLIQQIFTGWLQSRHMLWTR